VEKVHGHLHLAYIGGVDLIELAVALVIHVASLHRPVRRIRIFFSTSELGLHDSCCSDQHQRHARCLNLILISPPPTFSV
jgi:hypothetical protein